MIVVEHLVIKLSTISWREQATFRRNDDDVCFVLDQHAELDYYSASSLKQHSVRDMSPHLDPKILTSSQPV